jgi:hypothetical protein
MVPTLRASYILPQVRSQARGEAQMDRVFDDRGCQEPIEEFDQSITTASEGGIHGMSKGAQALKGRCVHAVSIPKRAFLVYPSSPTPCCWLNGKLRGCVKRLQELFRAKRLSMIRIIAT